MSAFDRITAIIPARSGSKRLPNKNIRDLGGRPLLFHTIDAVLDHEVITEVIFTTDSKEYIDLVRSEYGQAVNCVHRPEEFAADTTKVTAEVNRLITDDKIRTEWFLVSLPTSPLFDHSNMRNFLDNWRNKRVATFTCHEYDFSPLFAFSINEHNKWEGLLGEDSPMTTGMTRSQDLKKYYRPNGAGYICSRQSFLNTNIFYADAEPYKIDPILGTDIDNLSDFQKAEYILEHKNG